MTTTATAKAQPLNTIQKHIDLADFKSLEVSDGGFGGYASVAGNLDSVGDIIPVGAYANLEELTGSGWVCGDHSWGMKDECGIILSAKEDGTGLFIEAEFHSDDESQALRQKVQKRLARGKSVKMSIGFSLLKQPIILYPHQYEKELPKYLKQGYLRDGMARAKEFSQIRILPKIRVYECSIVSVPANEAANVASVKSNTQPTPQPISNFKLAMRELEQDIVMYEMDLARNEMGREAELTEMLLQAKLWQLEDVTKNLREQLKDSPFKERRMREAKRKSQQHRINQLKTK